MNKGSYDDKTIIKSELAHLMIPQPMNAKDLNGTKEYTKGFYVYKSSKPNVVGTNGYDPGVRSRMWFDTKDNLGVILLTNTSFIGEIYESYFMDIYREIWKYAYELTKE